MLQVLNTDTPEGNIKRTKKKKILYSLIIFILLCLCVVHGWMIISSTQNSAQRLLGDWATLGAGQLHKNIEYSIGELNLALSEVRPSPPKNEEEAKVFLKKIELQLPGQALALATRDGALMDSSGQRLGEISEIKQFTPSAQRRYLVTSAYSFQEKAINIFEVLPAVPGDTQYYLVRRHVTKDYTTQILKDVMPMGTFTGIYNQDSELICCLQSYETHISDNDIYSTLRANISDFVSSNEQSRLKQLSFSPDYAIYLKIKDIPGWVLGVHIPAAKFLPLFNGVLITSFTVVLSLIGMVAFVILLDIINDRYRQKELAKISCVDLLTGLLNTSGFQSTFKENILAAPTGQHCLVAIDISHFRRFNGMFGYSTGDNLLRTIGNTLKTHYSLSARISSNTFLFVAQTSPALVDNVDLRLSEAVANDLGKQYMQVLGFKYGVYPILTKNSYGEVYDGVLLALKTAKKDRQVREVIFDENLQKQSEMQKQIEMNMLYALSKNEFLFYVQPKYNLQAQQCSGGEALVRWNSEKLGFLMPDEFIPIFEKNGFILEIDFFMLAKALQLLQKQIKKGIQPQPISVNLSKVTLTFPNYLERLESLIKKYDDVPLSLVELEITETIMEGNYDTVVSLMYALKTMGFTISMDDFGSGYSSLNTLRELPVDILKIDKEFLKISDTSERSRKIIQSVIGMSKDLDITVVCEGVETSEEVDFLNACGCDIIQGYFYARPMPYVAYEEDFLAPLQAQATAPDHTN